MAGNSVFDQIVEQYGSRLESLTVVERLEILGFVTESLIHKERNPELDTQECFEITAFDLSTGRSTDVIKILRKASKRDLISFIHAIVSQLSQN